MPNTSDKRSFLQSLLPSTAKSERNNVSNRIKEIEKNIAILQKDVCEAMAERFRNFERFEASDQKEFKKCQEALVEMDNLSTQIDNEVKLELANSTQELMELKESLKETSLSLSFVNQLLSIKNATDDAVKALANGKYVTAASSLQQAKNLLDSPMDSLDQLLLFGVLKEDWSTQYSNFRHTLYDEWGNYLQLEKGEEIQGTKTISLKILNTDAAQLKDILEAFYQMFESSFYRFGKRLLQDIFIPIITHTAEVNVYQNEASALISIEMKLTEAKPSVTAVIENITKVVEFLNKEMSIPMDGGGSYLKQLGSFISSEFIETLIEKCLMHTLPSSRQEMNSYTDTLDLLNKFALDLQKVDFLEANGILEFIKQVDVLFVNKACAVFLEKARFIMKKDLHDAITVGPENPSVGLNEIIPSIFADVTVVNKNKQAVNLNRIFAFPECRVSKWTLELMKLTEEVLDEALEHKEQDRNAFYQTARNIFVLYLDVVPIYHKQFLETIAQLVALFHNNCMYLAHRLLTLGFEHRSHLFGSETNGLIFVDLVQPLRTLGAHVFLELLREQRETLQELTKESGLAMIGESRELPPSVEKSIRKCLRKLEYLHSVWREILPSEVYNKSIGGLLNAWIGEIIAKICSVEDISASAVNDLIRVFTTIVERAPKVFKVQTDIVKHVKQWSKFKELIKVLGCTLKEIEERWGQGGGTLAQQFTAEQVKHLVRALFQNTEVRGSVLARIH